MDGRCGKDAEEVGDGYGDAVELDGGNLQWMRRLKELRDRLNAPWNTS